jgi:hypothetical protein
MLASAALLLAATCSPFGGVSDATDSGAGDSGAGDGATEGSADAGDPGGAVLVREAANTASNAATLTVTLPTPPADGHVLVLLVGSNGAYPTKVAGGGATSWTNPVQAGAHVATAIWVGLGVSGAVPDVTITWNAQQLTVAALLTEWAGLSAIDSSGASSGGSSATPTVTPFAAVPGQLLFAAAGTQSPASAPTNGFTAVTTTAASGSVRMVGAYLKVASNGSYGTGWTMSPSNGWDTILVALH